MTQTLIQAKERIALAAARNARALSLAYLKCAKKELPPLFRALGQLVQLQFLDLSGFPDTTLPPEIGKLRFLESLCLADSQLPPRHRSPGPV